MAQNVFITGTGREMALGFNFVRRYLEQGDTVFATVRRPSEALERLRGQYPDRLHIITIDIGDTASVNAAAAEVAKAVNCIDLIINNAVITAPDTAKPCMEANMDDIAKVLDVDAVGPMRVIKALWPLLEKSDRTALIVNISSEAGSIGACYRTFYLDYGMAKAALNMATMTLRNYLKDIPGINAICVHPGWMRTNEGNAAAPLDPYEHAETMRLLFERMRDDKNGPVFVTYEGVPYPW